MIQLPKDLVNEIDRYIHELFSIHRSITGPGNRRSLEILQGVAPIEIQEYQCGEQVYDWVIPDEWSVRDAWLKDSNGNKIVSFHDNSLHLLGYSEAVNIKLAFEDLKPHLYRHVDLPEAIPYRTSYYKRNWGFCVTQEQYELLHQSQGKLEVCIDSEFNPDGSLTIGELLVPGRSKQEVLISTYICHPSLANDNLSGMVMTAFLARAILELQQPKYSYRIIWVPETIGAIAYCSKHEQEMKSIRSGLVVATVGGPGKFGYKQSYNKDHSVNRAIEEVFKQEGIDFITYPFDIHGSDERQYSSQGFRINVASITKDKYYEYPFYHSSLDNLDFVKADFIAESLFVYLKVIENLEQEDFYQSKYPNCEVMLSQHGLYPHVGGAMLPAAITEDDLDLVLWLLWLCDGSRGLSEISHKMNTDIQEVRKIVAILFEKGILEEAA